MKNRLDQFCSHSHCQLTNFKTQFNYLRFWHLSFSLLVGFKVFSLALLATPCNAQQPNILFIAVDDLNDYISPLSNHPGVITPGFERLARRSTVFTNAHCAAPACHPSRVAVMTGVHPSKSGIYRNLFGAHGPRWRDESPELKNAVVLSQHFRNNGYHAVGGGKIFHTLQWTPGDSQNDPEAWDDYRGDPLDPISKDWPRPNFRQHQNDGFHGKRPLSNHLFGAAIIDNAQEQNYGDHLVADWAIEQLNQNHDKPLFLAVGLFRPHIPWEVPKRWFDLYPVETVQLPKYQRGDLKDAHDHGRKHWHKWVEDNNQWRKLMQGYLASISYVDHQVNRILDGLNNSPKADNTIIVLWSDHGFHIGEKENWEKFALWNQTTRVPLFVSLPNQFEENGFPNHARTNQPVTLTDLYPTLCELAQIPTPEQCSGLSFLDQLRNPDAARIQPALTSFFFHRENAASHAISGTRFRYLKYGNNFEELYDLENDPNEFINEIDNPNFTRIKNKLRNSIPSHPADNRTVPTDSEFHRGRFKTKLKEDVK